MPVAPEQAASAFPFNGSRLICLMNLMFYVLGLISLFVLFRRLYS